MRFRLPDRKTWLPVQRTSAAPTLALLLFLGFAGCGTPRQPPIAELRSSTPPSLLLPWPTFEELELSIRPLRGLQSSSAVIVFAHLIDGNGLIVRTFDHPVPAEWSVEAELRDRFPVFQSALAPPLPAGDYELVVGLYEVGGEKLPVKSALRSVRRNQYLLAQVSIPETVVDASLIAFEGAWSEPEQGRDRQLVAAIDAIAGSDGRLHLSGDAAGKDLLLALALPGPTVPGSQVELLGEDNLPEVAIDRICTGSRRLVSGPGLHIEILPAPVAPGAFDCSIGFSSNFSVRPWNSTRARTFRLGAVAIRAD